MDILLAGTRFSLHFTEPELVDRCADRYARFVVPPSGADIRADILGAPVPATSSAAMTARLDGHLLVVEQAGVPPWGTLDRRTGEARIVPHRSLAALDVLLRAEVTLRALQAGGCALHAAAVALSDGVHLFPGVSGTGKSTVAQHLAREGGRVLSDEFVVVLPAQEGAWTVHGSPFWDGSPAPGRLVRAWRLGRDGLRTGPLASAETARLLVGNLNLLVRTDDMVTRALAAVARMATDVKGSELHYGLGQPIRGILESGP